MKVITLPTPKNAQEALSLTRVIDRAAHLFLEGYRYETSRQFFAQQGKEQGVDDIFGVHTPAGEMYVVDGLKGTCDCPHFSKNRFCKHYLAVMWQELEIEVMERRAQEEADADEGSNDGGIRW